MNERIFLEIESKIDKLINRIDELERENAALKAQQASWDEERALLLKKNETARDQVEAMIARLKQIDTEN